MSYQCANCFQQGCKHRDMERTLESCPSKNDAVQRRARELYGQEENQRIARESACVEKEGYCRLSRLEEIMLFARRAGYRRLGLVFCVGLHREANEVNKILTYNGFEVVSVACKNGALPKSSLGLGDDETLSGCADEVMCNPIGQALLMNEEKTQFNILLGLCVGHDSLALKYLEAPATILAVKDRVTGHNPLAAVYLAEGYYKKRFFPEPAGE